MCPRVFVNVEEQEIARLYYMTNEQCEENGGKWTTQHCKSKYLHESPTLPPPNHHLLDLGFHTILICPGVPQSAQIISIHISKRTNIHICIHTYVYICTHMYIYICTCTYRGHTTHALREVNTHDVVLIQPAHVRLI